MKASLSTVEISFYALSWILAVGYAMKSAFHSGTSNFQTLLGFNNGSDFAPGLFEGSAKDVSDFEWSVFRKVLIKAFPWLFVHLIGSRWFGKRKKLRPFYAIFGASFLLYVLNSVSAVAFIALQPAAFLLVMRTTRSQALIYALSLCYIVFQELYGFTLFEERENEVGDAQEIADVAGNWINLRCVSFCIERLWSNDDDVKSLSEDAQSLFAYAFYLPTVATGPIVNYDKFQVALNGEDKKWNSTKFLQTFLRYAFWFIVAELVFHCFYFSALSHNYGLLAGVDLWTLSGIGLAMGHFFYIKYVIFYGIPKAFLEAEDIEAPQPPQCISRIHLYSEMWRNFDNGLYKFMHKYYYKPIVTELGDSLFSRILASAVIFAFVLVFHGFCHSHVIMWCLINFFGVCLEATARTLSKWRPYQNWEKRLLTPQGQRRFYCLLGAPLFLMSILSNFYYVMGAEVGDIFAHRLYDSWSGTTCILFFTYCGAQTSFEIKNWEISKRIRSQKKLQ